MERLTNVQGVCIKCIGCIEESNCEQECDAIENCTMKLKEYEDLEERGLLVKLPCKVGDTLYRIDIDSQIDIREIQQYHIDNIVICDDGDILFKYDALDGCICNLDSIVNKKPYLDYYMTYLTKEEAEQKLNELN